MAQFLVFYFIFLPGGIILALILFRFVMIGMDCVKYLVDHATK